MLYTILQYYATVSFSFNNDNLNEEKLVVFLYRSILLQNMLKLIVCKYFSTHLCFLKK